VAHLLTGHDLSGDEALLDEQGAVAHVAPFEGEHLAFPSQ
jgi:hypothetical protein